MNDHTATKCEHRLLENGIHEFVIREGSMAGADAYMAALERIYQPRTADSEPLRVLMDSGTASLPIHYTLQRGKELRDKYPNIGMIYTVTLTERIVEARLADSMVRLMRFPNTRVRFFEMGRRDEAIQWLLEQR